MRILITGANGQLGLELQRTLDEDEVLATIRDQVDIENRAAVSDAITRFRPDVVVHAAAYTNVDGCETDPDLAYRVNALGTQNVALACAQVDAAMVYVSSDYVFDGSKGAPYLEFDDPNPISTYGRSKLAGERYVQMSLRKYYIVRTAWLYGVGKNFVRTILSLADRNGEVLAVTDEVGSPTFARDLAEAIDKLVRHPVYGIYHLTNDGSCSRHDYVKAICEAANRKVSVIPITSEEFLARHPLPARRPPFSVLHNFCASNALGIRLRPWQEALASFISSENLAIPEHKQ
ncbi:MAG: dTDP-4-dehydrorhamnose reductase [Chloroflexi bacterium]|nr:dTDP-4-dehydrorhamnose reductase [Chloroflexota bacterium]MDA8188345.1 dTDP-4-dehydrorhamnose reductase [Dehalococcoidales bacterium]